MIFTAGLGSGSVPIIQLRSIARSPMIPWIADFASSAGTSSPKPPADPKARRKNLSLFGGPRTLFEQIDTARSHFRVFFVGEQFEAVGEGTDRADRKSVG